MREGKRKSVASLSITAFQIWFRMTAPSVTSGNKIKVTRQGADSLCGPDFPLLNHSGEENQGHKETAFPETESPPCLRDSVKLMGESVSIWL